MSAHDQSALPASGDNASRHIGSLAFYKPDLCTSATCVEVAAGPAGVVVVSGGRLVGTEIGPALTYTADEFAVFVESLLSMGVDSRLVPPMVRNIIQPQQGSR